MRPAAAAAGIAAALLLMAGTAVEASTEGDAPADSVRQEAGPTWSHAASAYFYIVPEDDDFLLATVTADRGALHLEGRYNYEDLETGSFFVGWNFGAGDRVTLEVTPMVGAVFGQTKGVAPAVKVTLGYDRLEFYSEAEYVFDADDSSESFFYSWSELGFSATDRIQAGLIGQRTRTYQTDVEYQRGLWARYSGDRLDLTGYVLNLGWDDATFILAASVPF